MGATTQKLKNGFTFLQRSAAKLKNGFTFLGAYAAKLKNGFTFFLHRHRNAASGRKIEKRLYFFSAPTQKCSVRQEN